MRFVELESQNFLIKLNYHVYSRNCQLLSFVIFTMQKLFRFEKYSHCLYMRNCISYPSFLVSKYITFKCILSWEANNNNRWALATNFSSGANQGLSLSTPQNLNLVHTHTPGLCYPQNQRVIDHHFAPRGRQSSTVWTANVGKWPNGLLQSWKKM